MDVCYKSYTSYTSAINWLINGKGTLEILKLGFKITSTPCFLRPGKPMYVIYTKESKQYPLDWRYGCLTRSWYWSNKSLNDSKLLLLHLEKLSNEIKRVTVSENLKLKVIFKAIKKNGLCKTLRNIEYVQ